MPSSLAVLHQLLLQQLNFGLRLDLALVMHPRMTMLELCVNFELLSMPLKLLKPLEKLKLLKPLGMLVLLKLLKPLEMLVLLKPLKPLEMLKSLKLKPIKLLKLWLLNFKLLKPKLLKLMLLKHKLLKLLKLFMLLKPLTLHELPKLLTSLRPLELLLAMLILRIHRLTILPNPSMLPILELILTRLTIQVLLTALLTIMAQLPRTTLLCLLLQFPMQSLRFLHDLPASRLPLLASQILLFLLPCQLLMGNLLQDLLLDLPRFLQPPNPHQPMPLSLQRLRLLCHNQQLIRCGVGLLVLVAAIRLRPLQLQLHHHLLLVAFLVLLLVKLCHLLVALHHLLAALHRLLALLLLFPVDLHRFLVVLLLLHHHRQLLPRLAPFPTLTVAIGACIESIHVTLTPTWSVTSHTALTLCVLGVIRDQKLARLGISLCVSALNFQARPTIFIPLHFLASAMNTTL